MSKIIPPRLRWACRRGMLELDVLLGNFLEEAFLFLPESEQALFIKLLDASDQDLFLWLTGKVIPSDQSLIPVIKKIRDHAKYRHHH
ncbi:MAG: cptB [Gammaproteobacteria bacterium]|jgi:antitoxin CptB|nr:cptB [Gammaproteobacteria bacterium]MCE3238040.1 cptB [Gammaproteobacteria bacterium]